MTDYEMGKDMLAVQQQIARIDYKLDMLLKAADIKEEEDKK